MSYQKVKEFSLKELCDSKHLNPKDNLQKELIKSINIIYNDITEYISEKPIKNDLLLEKLRRVETGNNNSKCTSCRQSIFR